MRILLVAVVAVLGLLASGCDGAPPASGPSTPSAPDDARWIGVDDLVVAAPSDWEAVVGSCRRVPRDAVFVVDRIPPSMRCSTPVPQPAALMVFGPGIGGAPRVPKMLRLTVDGVNVRSTPVSCRGDDDACTLVFRVDDIRTTFHAGYDGPHPERFLRELRASLTRLPDGFTTVPLVEYGVSDADALEVLDQAGLTGVAPDVDFPHYVTGTDPVAGTVVADGQEVALTVGDG